MTDSGGFHEPSESSRERCGITGATECNVSAFSPSESTPLLTERRRVDAVIQDRPSTIRDSFAGFDGPEGADRYPARHRTGIRENLVQVQAGPSEPTKRRNAMSSPYSCPTQRFCLSRKAALYAATGRYSILQAPYVRVASSHKRESLKRSSPSGEGRQGRLSAQPRERGNGGVVFRSTEGAE